MNDKPTITFPLPRQPESFSLASQVLRRPISLDMSDREIGRAQGENATLLDGAIRKLQDAAAAAKPDWPHTVDVEIFEEGEVARIRVTFKPKTPDTP